MQFFLLMLLAGAALGACIWFLHKLQQRSTAETVDRTAPLDALDGPRLADFAPAPVPEATPAATPAATPPATREAAPEAAPAQGAATSDNWLGQIRALRESSQLAAALDLSKSHFPKTQAFQQAAIILRQQIREGLEQSQPVATLLGELYHAAALADLFRSSNSHKARDPLAALAAVRNSRFNYAEIGHLRLKLLNKSDVRALEQLWGQPATHRHVDEVLGEDWLRWCRPPG